MLWLIETAECIKTLIGHTKIVNDCDFHPCFQRYTKELCFLTCSGDTTLRLWNSVDNNARVIIHGHTQAVYKCSFAPDGNSIVSCSEDCTIRTWCYPEGYLIYIYQGHHSPVTTVRFSPTGKYLISGSDYGERKILMWNSKMPILNDPQQFPHVIFWTPHGLIRKILIHQGKPKPVFWLQKNMMSAITDDSMIDIWSGELDDPEVEDIPSESDDDDDEKEESEDDEETEKKVIVDPFIANDVRQMNGVSLSVVYVNSTGDQVKATEYNPGGHLFVCVQVIFLFLVLPIISLYDIYISI